MKTLDECSMHVGFTDERVYGQPSVMTIDASQKTLFCLPYVPWYCHLRHWRHRLSNDLEIVRRVALPLLRYDLLIAFD